MGFPEGEEEEIAGAGSAFSERRAGEDLFSRARPAVEIRRFLALVRTKKEIFSKILLRENPSGEPRREWMRNEKGGRRGAPLAIGRSACCPSRFATSGKGFPLSRQAKGWSIASPADWGGTTPDPC